MNKTRLEAFSDGVLAIIITIMILEIKVPEGHEFADLKPLIPKFLSYILSFIYVGIYWNNHHYLIHGMIKSKRKNPLGKFAFIILVVLNSRCYRLDGRT